MESRDGMSSGVIVITSEAPSNYHVAPRNENSTPNTIPMTVTPPVAPHQVSVALTGTTEKKKRGRPRKYDRPAARALSPMPISASAPPASGNYFVEKASAPRPIKSEKKQKQKSRTENLGEWVFCSSGQNFLPHMITVNAGEDVATKIISFAQQGPRAVCIISAVGVISDVTLRQPISSGGTLTYEGRFEILSLSGSFTPTEFGGACSRTGGMSISLASPDGRIVGGLLAGQLVAASPIQVVVGSFLPSNYHEVKPPRKQKAEAKLVSDSTAYPAITHHSSNAEQQQQQHFSSNTPHGLNSSMSSSSLHTQNGASTATDINISLQRD